MVGALVQSVEQLQSVDLSALEEANAESIAQLGQYIELMQQTITQLQAMSPIDMAMGMLSNNVSWSIVLSLPVALFVRHNKQTKTF